MKKYLLSALLTLTCQLFITNFLSGQTLVTLSTVGTGTWYPPVGCTSFYVQVWGGGAGGNGAYGGGGGSFSQSTTYTVDAFRAANGYSYTVGAGGAYNADGGVSKFEGCWAFQGLKNNAAPVKYVAGGQIASSYFGGWGGARLILPSPIGTVYGGGGGSAYTNANGSNANQYNGGAGTGNGGTGTYSFLGIAGTNGSAPGGGGGGQHAGGRGEIRIYYTCNYIAGAIGNPHTVPTPIENNNDPITNTANPTSFGYTFSWERSTDNANWTNITGANGSTYTLPQLATNTYFRRKINGCGTAAMNVTAPVLIKVFSNSNVNNGAPSKNGAITGFVRSRNGTGVAGITVYAQKNVAVKGSPQTHIYSVVTDVNGKYQFTNLFYGDKDAPSSDPTPVGFTLTPFKINHKFDPDKFNPVNLSFDRYSEPLGPNFKDTTVLAITGRVYQQCQGCLNGSNVAVNNITSGVDSAKVTGGDLPSYADALGIGNYATTVQDPGLRTLTPSYKNHTFSPSFISENIQDNVSGKNFVDTTTRTITGKLTDGGKESIGIAELEFSDTVKGRTTSAFRKRITTNASGEYSIVLPARAYKVKVINFISSFPNDNPRFIPTSDVGTFFNNLVPKDSVYRNVDTSNAVLNLMYHRKPVIQVVGLNDTTCNPALGIVFKQNVPKPFTINVFEGAPAIGFKVVTLDQIKNADSLSIGDSVKIWTDLTDQTGVTPPVFLAYRLKTGKIDSTLMAGVPNIISPFDRKFKVYYTDRYGRAAETITRNALTTGIQSPPQTFVTVAPEIPQIILHRPMGDLSYSYWEETKTISTSQRMSLALEGSLATFAEVKVGAEFSAGIGVQVVTKVEGSINASISTSVTNNTENELTFTHATTTKYSTKAGGITGSGGDVYIGGAMNYKYGISNVVAFNNGCAVTLSEKLIIAPKGYATTFTYSEDHITNTIMPALKYFVANTTGARSDSFKNQLNVWQQVIDNNKYQKENAKFIENRSFDGNAGGVEVSKTISKSASNTIEFNMAIAGEVAAAIGAEVNGTGVSGGVTVGLKVENGKSNTASQTTETTTGFLLQDQNAGDYFSVDIKEDRVYGTPVFELVAGTSSCPPEPGAQSRDNPRIIIDDPVVNNIPLNGKGFFTIKVVNQSESRETRNYNLSLNNATSNGVTIRKDGVALGGSDVIPINGLAYLEARDVLISVEKTNPADKIFSYPNIEFVLTDDCTEDVQQTNSITANFITPCGSIVLENPAEDWINTTADGNFLPVTFNGYTLASIDSVTLQYARAGTNNWQRGFTLQQFQITDPNSTTFPWNVSALADTLYKLRVRLVCSGGNIVYTTHVNGILDRKAPFVMGNPQPADNSYANGDEISFTYNEYINTGNLGAGNFEITRLSNNTTVDASIIGFENKVQVVPSGSLAAYIGDSVRVIVKNIADIYGNIKAIPDTSYFLIGTTPPLPGAKPVKIYMVNKSILENSNGTMEVHFKLPAPATRITKVHFTVSGSAAFLSDYTVSSDTIQKVVKDKFNNNITLPVYNYFNGYEGYIHIDSLASKAILKIKPVGDAAQETDETINLSLVSSGAYILEDSTTTSATILNDDMGPIIIVGDKPFNICAGDSVTLSLQTQGNQNFRYASNVKAFSSQYTNDGWAAFRALGAPDVYPLYADDGRSWASSTPDDQREYLELGYDNPSPINFIDIYENYKPGAVDTVYVKNPYTNQFEIVYTATAAPQPDVARKLRISFPKTTFPVSHIRIALNSPAVPDWNEIDAVGIGLNTGYASYIWSPGGATTPTIKVKTSGVYTVQVTDVNGLTGVSAPVNINVSGESPATANAGADLPGICPGVATSNLNGSFGGSATGAVWSDGGAGGSFTNNTGNTPNTATYTPAANANGTINLLLTTLGNGCNVSAIKKVFVNGQSTWLGLTNNWNAGTNWSNGVVPLGCTKVTIPNGLPFIPTISGANNTCFSLKLEPGATINVAPGAVLIITGNN